MRLAPVVLTLTVLTLSACSKADEAADATHAPKAEAPMTAEEQNRRAAEDAAAAATAPLESLPKAGPSGAPPEMADAAHAAPAAASADHAAPAAEAAPPPAEHH